MRFLKSSHSKTALFDDKNLLRWRESLDLYPSILRAYADTKRSPDKLKQLDSWFTNELVVKISSRKPSAYCKWEELNQLMEWKLSRGKFRPRLMQLVESNKKDAVETISKSAFRLLPDVKAAVKELTVLKGVGPATASGKYCKYRIRLSFISLSNPCANM